LTQPRRRLAQRVERALEVDGDVAVEAGIVGIGNLGDAHYAGIVDQHIDATEGRFGGVEEAADGSRVADIGLGSDRPAAGCLDLASERLGGGGVARVVDDDGKAVLGQPPRARRRSRWRLCFPGSWVSPGLPLRGSASDEKEIDLSLVRIIIDNSGSLFGKKE
jgi:hypothetical protein